jgi:trehalose 6-phosphate synthase
MPRGAGLILANRAFADHAAPPPDTKTVAGAGGLVAAVGAAIQPWDGQDGTLWVGAGRGTHDREFVDGSGFETLSTPRGPLRQQRLFFDDATWRGHYDESANSFLWPALHLVRPGLVSRAAFFPRPVVPATAAWEQHRAVNRAFARTAAASGRSAAWIHDYQLGLSPGYLREAGFEGRIGYFLHTPFARPRDIEVEAGAESVPLLREFVRGILGADLVGFQSERDSANFAEAAGLLCGASAAEGGVSVDGRGVALRVMPVGVNTEDVEGARPAIPPDAAGAIEGGLPLVVGLERADFTKGVPERLAAVAQAYDSGAWFAYYAAASPTRQGIALYEGFADVLEASRSEAARAAARAGCPFVHRMASLSWDEVVGLLARAQVVFTSSLADGLNLVPLQAAIAQSRRAQRGVAIAGRDAGIAWAYRGFEGQGLVIVDPLDTAATAAALVEALEPGAAGMSDAFVAAVRARDAGHWAASFLDALEGGHASS